MAGNRLPQRVHPTLTCKKLGWTRRRRPGEFLLFSEEVRSAMDVERCVVEPCEHEPSRAPGKRFSTCFIFCIYVYAETAGVPARVVRGLAADCAALHKPRDRPTGGIRKMVRDTGRVAAGCCSAGFLCFRAALRAVGAA